MENKDIPTGNKDIPTGNKNIPTGNKNPSRQDKELATAARGGGLGLMGMLCSRVLSILLQAAIARLFGITFFGYYITGLMLCRVFQVVAGLGLSIGSIRFMVQAMTHGNRQAMYHVYLASIFTPLLAGAFLGYLSYIASPFLCNRVFSEPDLLPVLQLFSIAVPFFSLLRILAELSRSFGTVRYTVLVEDILFPLLQAGVLVPAFIYNIDQRIAVIAFLTATVCCAAVMAGVVYWQMRQHVFPQTDDSTTHPSISIRELFIYSVPLMPTGIFFMVSNNIDIFMLNVFNSGAAVGIYGAATRWTVLVDSIGMPVSAIFRPLIARAVSANDTKMLRTLLMACSRWVLYLILPFIAFMFVASQPAMEFFLKEEAGAIASILLWTLLIARVTNPIGNGAGLVLAMGGHQYRELSSLAFGTVLNIILNMILIPYYGVIGAAIATGAGFYVTTILRVSFVRAKWEMVPWSKSMLIPAAALSLVIITRLLLNSVVSDALTLQLAGGVIAAFFVICCCILSFALEDDDRSIVDLLPKIAQKIIHWMESVVHTFISRITT